MVNGVVFQYLLAPLNTGVYKGNNSKYVKKCLHIDHKTLLALGFCRAKYCYFIPHEPRCQLVNAY